MKKTQPLKLLPALYIQSKYLNIWFVFGFFQSVQAYATYMCTCGSFLCFIKLFLQSPLFPILNKNMPWMTIEVDAQEHTLSIVYDSLMIR